MTLASSCQICGEPNRLVGIEPHHSRSTLDIWTFECTRCGSVEARSQAAPPAIVAARAADSHPERLN